jgi:hypothetical protein
LGDDEEICFLCAKEKSSDSIANEAEQEDWTVDITEEDPLPPEDLEISLEELEEQEREQDEDEDDINQVDDFEYVDPDDYDFDDDDLDDEDEGQK